MRTLRSRERTEDFLVRLQLSPHGQRVSANVDVTTIHAASARPLCKESARARDPSPRRKGKGEEKELRSFTTPPQSKAGPPLHRLNRKLIPSPAKATKEESLLRKLPGEEMAGRPPSSLPLGLRRPGFGFLFQAPRRNKPPRRRQVRTAARDRLSTAPALLVPEGRSRRGGGWQSSAAPPPPLGQGSGLEVANRRF